MRLLDFFILFYFFSLLAKPESIWSVPRHPFMKSSVDIIRPPGAKMLAWSDEHSWRLRWLFISRESREPQLLLGCACVN